MYNRSIRNFPITGPLFIANFDRNIPVSYCLYNTYFLISEKGHIQRRANSLLGVFAFVLLDVWHFYVTCLHLYCWTFGKTKNMFPLTLSFDCCIQSKFLWGGNWTKKIGYNGFIGEVCRISGWRIADSKWRTAGDYCFYCNNSNRFFQTITLLVMMGEAFVVLARQTSHFRVTRALRPIFVINSFYLRGVRRRVSICSRWLVK